MEVFFSNEILISTAIQSLDLDGVWPHFVLPGYYHFIAIEWHSQNSLYGSASTVQSVDAVFAYVFCLYWNLYVAFVQKQTWLGQAFASANHRLLWLHISIHRFLDRIERNWCLIISFDGFESTVIIYKEIWRYHASKLYYRGNSRANLMRSGIKYRQSI
jgi:hypothetical protein